MKRTTIREIATEERFIFLGLEMIKGQTHEIGGDEVVSVFIPSEERFIHISATTPVDRPKQQAPVGLYSRVRWSVVVPKKNKNKVADVLIGLQTPHESLDGGETTVEETTLFVFECNAKKALDIANAIEPFSN